MNIPQISAETQVNLQRNGTITLLDRPPHFVCEDPILAAARGRLAAANRLSQKQKAPVNDIYYPPRRIQEQRIKDLPGAANLDAIVTRNHYGSLVLNAYHALFIDVDMPEPGQSTQYEAAPQRGIPSRWQTTFDDLRTVLIYERNTGFRIYRTAAGFRILATTGEFDPGSDSAKTLMTSVGADDAFVRLCGTQQTFRARLTPKPWRCGTTQPPNEFPRQSADQQRSFDSWLTGYERACHDRATCQFLDHVGPTNVHSRVAPIVEFHDRITKARQQLALA